MKILIAEDDRVSSRILLSQLSRWDYEVKTTSNGYEALEQLQKENAPRIAILDWMMPELDGIEVCRQVRSKPTTLPIYIIMLTAKNQKEDILESFHAGVDDYIKKPIEMNELQARVNVEKGPLIFKMNFSTAKMNFSTALKNLKSLAILLTIFNACCLSVLIVKRFEMTLTIGNRLTNISWRRREPNCKKVSVLSALTNVSMNCF